MTKKEALSSKLWDYLETSSGWFQLQDIYKELTIYKEEDKHNIREQIRIFTNKGLLERNYRVNGRYRRVQDELVELDLLHAVEVKAMDVKFPFGLERVFKPLPHSIWAVAGAPNAGKTSFAMDFCLMNQWKHHVVYFSSEMGASRLRARLNKHPLVKRDGIGFQAFARGSDFHDVIKKFPNAIVVIDFLEIYENFYEIGSKIKLMFDAMQGDTSVLLLIQKNPSRKNIKGQTEYVDLGRGGNFGLEKASLYVAMDNSGDDGHSRLKIVKAKEWQHENINPNNMEFQYKLINGCSFVSIKEPIGFPPAARPTQTSFEKRS